MKNFTRLFIATIAIFVSACGKKETPPATSGPASAPLRPFEILIDWQAEPTYLGIYYAKARGDFAKLGLDAKIIQSWGANDAAAAIAAGRYVIGTASGAATVIANSSGAKLVSTAVLYHRLPTAVFGLAETGIKTPKDLHGKTIGIYSKSVTKNEFDAFAKLNGVDLKKVAIVSLSGPDLPLILTKKVDAVLNYFELSPTQLALERPTFELLLDHYGVKGYGLNIVTSREQYAKDRAFVEAISTAMIGGYRDGCADREAAVTAFLKEFPEKDGKYVRLSWDKVCAFIGNEYGNQTTEGWQQTIDLYQKLGLLNGAVTPSDVISGGTRP